jgi:RimJ/RimL family protein N-acetyltransferase
MAKALSDPVLYEFTGGAPPTPADLRDLYAGWIAGPSRDGEAWHNWAVRLVADGTLIGHVQATVLDGGTWADVAWILGTPWQGRGYATEAAIAMVRWLESVGVATITAHVHPQHAASARVAERSGLEPTDEVKGGEVVWRRRVTRNG